MGSKKHAKANHRETIETRRNFLYLTASAMCVVGIGAVTWILVDSMNPAADVLSRLRMEEIDLSFIKPGQRAVAVWHRLPILIHRRTDEEIRQVRAEDWHDLRDPQSDESRVKPGHDEWLILKDICTREGCVTIGNKAGDQLGDWGGWRCPCCGSSFDKSGRVRRGPAPKNLIVPDYVFVADSRIHIREIPA